MTSPDDALSRPASSTVAVLVGILVLAAALRVVSLGEVPPALFVDEASVGANARLLGQAGIDQYGTSFPVFFRALDDWKCGLFLYSLAPLLAVVEPTEVTIRLPSVVWGLLGIVVTFLLARELCRSDSVGLWAALFLTLTPWHVHYSRIAWQAFTLTVVYPAALLFLVRWFRTRSSTDALLAGALCGLTLYTYTVAKLLIPLTLIGVALGLVRMRVGIRDRDPWWFAAALLVVVTPFTVAYLVHHDAINHRLGLMMLPVSEIPLAYLSYFHPGFLWIAGDGNLRHGPGQGLLPWYLAPFLLAGLVDLALRGGRARWWLLGALFCMPLLGSLSIDYPHASRTLGLMPIVQIVAAIGIVTLLDFVKTRAGVRVWRISLGALAVVMAVTTGFFVNAYWGGYVDRSRAIWNDGLLPALRVAAAERAPGEKILTRPGHAHYAHWMVVTDPPAELILRNRERLQSSADRYDSDDVANKYRFLGFLSVAVDRGGPQNLPGIWVFKKSGVDPGRLREQARRGWVELLYENDGYIVLRSRARQGR